MNTLDRSIVLTLEHSKRSVAAVGHEERIGRGHVTQSLRSLNIPDDMHHFARAKIHDADAVVLEFGDEQAPPPQVDGHVIDAAANVSERDLGFEHQRSLCLGSAAAGKERSGY